MTTFQDEIIPSIKLNRPQDFATLLNEALQQENVGGGAGASGAAASGASGAAPAVPPKRPIRNKPFLLKGSRAKRTIVKPSVDENTFEEVREALARREQRLAGSNSQSESSIRFDEDMFRLPQPDLVLLGSPLNTYSTTTGSAIPAVTQSEPAFFRNTSATVGSRLETLTIQAERKLATLESKLQLLQDRETRVKEREAELARQRREFQEDTRRRSALLQEERETFNKKVRDKEEILMATEQRLKSELARASKRGAECEETRQEITHLKLMLVEQQKAAQDKEERYKKMLTSRAARIAALERKIESLNATLSNFTGGKLDSTGGWTNKFNGAKNSPRQLERLRTELCPEPSIKSVSSCSLPPLETETSTQTLATPFEGLSQTLRSTSGQHSSTQHPSTDNKFSRLVSWNHMAEWQCFVSILSNIPPANSEQPSRTNTRKDGAQEHVYPSDGRREVTFPSGLRRVVLPSGWVISFFANGDIKGLDPVKARAYYKFSEDNILAITLSGGITYNYFAVDGQLDCRLPDGTIQVRFPNGVMKQIDPDGREHVA